MELMFITLGGAIIGLCARYALPQRHRHGAVLIPALAAAASAAIWVALTWAGMKWDGGWIWWITVIATAVIAVVVDLVVGSTRKRGDDRLLRTLSNGAVNVA